MSSSSSYHQRHPWPYKKPRNFTRRSLFCSSEMTRILLQHNQFRIKLQLSVCITGDMPWKHLRQLAALAS